MNERWKSRLARLRWAVIAGVLTAGRATAAWAQTESGGQNEAYQPPEPSYTLDLILLAVLVGAAVFAICRSSRRS